MFVVVTVIAGHNSAAVPRIQCGALGFEVTKSLACNIRPWAGWV